MSAAANKRKVATAANERKVATANLAGPQGTNVFEYHHTLQNSALQSKYEALLDAVGKVDGTTASAFAKEDLSVVVERLGGNVSQDILRFAESLLERSLLDVYLDKFIAESRLVSLMDRNASVKSDRVTTRPTVICGHTNFSLERWLEFVFEASDVADGPSAAPLYPSKLVKATHSKYPAFPEAWEPHALAAQVIVSCIFDAVASKIVRDAAVLAGISDDDFESIVKDARGAVSYKERVKQLTKIAATLAKAVDVVTLVETPYDVAVRLMCSASDRLAVVVPVPPRPNDTQLSVMLVRKDVVSHFQDVSAEVHALVCKHAKVKHLAVPSAHSIVAIRELGGRTYVGFHSTSDGSTMPSLLAALAELDGAVAMGDANCVEKEKPGQLTRASLLKMVEDAGGESTYAKGDPTMNRFRTKIGAQPRKASVAPERECKDGVIVTKGKIVASFVHNNVDFSCDDGERPTTEWPTDHYAATAVVSFHP